MITVKKKTGDIQEVGIRLFIFLLGLGRNM